MLVFINHWLWWSGAAINTVITGLIIWRLSQTIIFMYRLGWEATYLIGLWHWLEFIIYPPASLYGVYYPSREAAYMRELHQQLNQILHGENQ